MHSVRRLIKAVAGPVDGFGLPLDLGPQTSLKHVHDHRAGVRVWRRGFTRTVMHRDQLGSQVPAVHGWREVSGEDRAHPLRLRRQSGWRPDTAYGKQRSGCQKQG
jgi:hypothetical protein